VRYIYEDGEPVFGYGGVVFNDELEVLDGLELVPLEQCYVRLRVANEMFYSWGVLDVCSWRGRGGAISYKLVVFACCHGGGTPRAGLELGEIT
jgi:hypothetical protein